MNQPIYHYLPKSLSAGALVKGGGGLLKGVIVTASASGVIRLYDSTSASGTVILDQFAAAPGDSIEMPVEFKQGLYFDLVSGTATVTILYI